MTTTMIVAWMVLCFMVGVVFTMPSRCEKIEVQFTAGYMDGIKEYNQTVNNSIPLLMQYCTSNQDCEMWNSISSNTWNKFDDIWSVTLPIPVSGMPHLQLRWVQVGIGSLCIRNINLIQEESGETNCDKNMFRQIYASDVCCIIDHATASSDDTLVYVFNGTVRELRLCTMNLNGKANCIGRCGNVNNCNDYTKLPHFNASSFSTNSASSIRMPSGTASSIVGASSSMSIGSMTSSITRTLPSMTSGTPSSRTSNILGTSFIMTITPPIMTNRVSIAGTSSIMTSGTPSNRNSVIAGTPSSVMAGTPSSVTSSIVETSPIMINSIAGTSSSMTHGAPSSYSSTTSHVLGTPASTMIETPSPSHVTSGTPFSVTGSLIGTPIVSVRFCFNNTAGDKAMINSTRRILCNITTDFKFVTQICSTFEDDEIQPNWFPELPVTCVENGLAISENLFRINSNVTDVADQIEALLLYLNDTTTSITAGDLILSSNILVEAGCSRNNQTFLVWSLLLENTAVIEILEKNQQLVFVYNLFTATDLYCYDKNTSLSTNSIRLIVLKLDLSDPLRNITSVSLSHDNLATFVIPGSVLEAAQTEGESEFTAVSYLINGLQNILSSRSLSGSEALYRLVSPVVSLTISCSFQSCADAVKTDGIEFVIKHNRNISNSSSTVCAFWNFSIAREYEPFWSTEGCEKVDQTAEQTKCVCNHLTHFGILFDSRGGSSQISSENKTALSLVTYLGVGFSLLALILTMISFVILRSQWSLRTFVHINLCCTLFFAQLIFVLGIDKTSNDVVCATIAVLLHYLFLTTFMWMLAEGVVLYIVLVKVFAQIDWKYYTGFTLLCYGGPLLYMILCVPLGLARRNEWSYGSDDFCWLTYNDHFIWAFIAPVLVLITINIGFLIMAIRIMKRHQTEAAVAERTSKERAWYWFRGSMSLIIIMGINWVFGVILFHEYILPLIYLFAITTSLQGVWIFLLFVIGSKQVRDDYSKWFRTVHMSLSELKNSLTASQTYIGKSSGNSGNYPNKQSATSSTDKFMNQNYRMYDM